MSHFGTLLRRYRERRTVVLRWEAGGWRDAKSFERPLSQNELARRAQIDPAYVNRLEKGSQPNPPSRAIVLRLADVLELDQVETDELLIAAGHCPAMIASLDDDRRRALLMLLAR